MRHIRNTVIALVALSGAVAIAAQAQVPYAYDYAGAPGSYYSFGANRAYPSVAPNGWDQDNPRDFQLQGSR